jgi:putative FmdB family regulatory protein
MPIYAYRCADCGHTKDVLQKISDAPLVDCPACGAPSLRKQLTAAGFQLKGSGWYATDFRNGSSAKSSDESAKPGGDAAKTDSGTDAGKPSDSSATAAKPAASAAAGACGGPCACH